MNARSPSYLRRAAIGTVAALAIGLVTVATCDAAGAIARRLPVTTRWDDGGAVRVALASAPYLVLALAGVDARRAWATGLCFTGALWGFYLWSITRGAGPDANIGLGLLMMASPLVVTAASLAALVAAPRRRGRDGTVGARGSDRAGRAGAR